MLNDRERRMLARIERQLVESDPRLARMFASHRHPHEASPTVLLAVGLAIVVLGSITMLIPLVVIGMVASLGALAVAVGRQGGMNRPMTA